MLVISGPFEIETVRPPRVQIGEMPLQCRAQQHRKELRSRLGAPTVQQPGEALLGLVHGTNRETTDRNNRKTDRKTDKN